MLALDFVGDARGHDSPSLSSLSAIALPVVLLVAAAIQTAVPSLSTSPCCCAGGAFLPPAARWCCRTGKCARARAARRQRAGGVAAGGQGLPALQSVCGALSGCWGSRGGPGGAGRCWSRLGAASRLHQFLLPRDKQPIAGDPSIHLCHRYGVSGQCGWKFPLCLCLRHAQGRDSFGLSVVGWYVPE